MSSRDRSVYLRGGLLEMYDDDGGGMIAGHGTVGYDPWDLLRLVALGDIVLHAGGDLDDEATPDPPRLRCIRGGLT